MSSFRPLVTALLGRFFSVVALMADGFMVDILMASVFLDPEIACAPPAVSRASRTPAAPAIPGGLCAAHFSGSAALLGRSPIRWRSRQRIGAALPACCSPADLQVLAAVRDLWVPNSDFDELIERGGKARVTHRLGPLCRVI